jgi:hypothetical protein
MLVRRSTREELLSNFEKTKFKGHGKNFQPLVAAGAWEISGFQYGRSKCACCGRPIVRVLKLKNQCHEAALERDPTYSFPEEIDIGIVCGPKVFGESCLGFYDDTAAEWKRQYRMWREYINFVMLHVQNKDLWEMLPASVRDAIDEYLDTGGFKPGEEPTTASWWRIRDAKKKYLKTKRNEKVPVFSYLTYNARVLLNVAQRLCIVDAGTWTVEVSQFNTMLVKFNGDICDA